MAYGTITNTIQDPSGTPVPNVVVNARLMPGAGFLPVTYYEMSTLETTTTDVNGAWTLSLEVNTDISPGDSYYEIEELIPASAGVPTVWSVQVAAGSHTLYASLVTTPPYQPVPSYITQSSGDARYIQTGGDVGGNIQAVGTMTITGTATVGAPANHAHALSPAVVGSGLALTAGVLSTAGPGAIGGLIQAIGTATQTGTATTAAADNHVHPLSPAIAGSGLTLTAGVLSVTNLAPAAGNEITAVGTNTATGTTTTFARTNHGHALNPSVVGSGLSLAAGVILGPVQGSRIQTVATVTVTGTATSWAADNHQHVLDPGVAGTGLTHVGGVLNAALAGSLIQPVGVNTTTGTSTAFARENHAHALSPAVVGTGLGLAAGVLSVSAPVVLGGAQDITAVNTATATGTATTVAASNHQHSLSPSIISNGLLIAAGVVTANYGGAGDIAAINTATATGTTTTVARANHQHALGGGIVLPSNMSSTAYGADLKNVNTATATGVATTFARSDHQHGIDSSIVGTGLSLTAGVLSATGAAFTYGDGASDITSISTNTSTGTATSVSRSNHVHTINPAVAGSGLALTTGVLSAKNLTNSNAASSFLYSITSTNTATATVATGQMRYSTGSNALFVFNSGVWQCVTPITTVVATSETYGSTSYAALTTAQAVTILTGTQALLTLTCRASSNITDYSYISAAVSGASTIAASDTWALQIVSATGGFITRASATTLITGLTAGLNTFSLQVRQNGASTGTYSDRGITVVAVPT